MQKNFGLLELELTFHADFGHDQVAAVAQDLFFGKRDGRGGRRRIRGNFWFGGHCKTLPFVSRLVGSAAGDGGHDADDIAIAQRRLIFLQVTDVFVVHIDVHETAQAAVV